LNHQFLDFKLINVQDTSTILEQCQGDSNNTVFISFPSADKPMEEFLSKILSAVKLDLKKDVLVLEKTPNNNFSYGGLQKAVGIQKAIFFGITPSMIGLQVNHQKYQAFSINGCTFLFGDTLSQINKNQSLKKALWVALQGMFS